MPRTLSSNLVADMMAAFTGGLGLVCLVIDHASLSAPLRIVNNGEDISVNGNTYTATAFQILLPKDRSDGAWNARIRLNNTDQWLTATIRTLTGVWDIDVLFVYATDEAADPPEFDTVEFQLSGMTLDSVQWDENEVEGVLSWDNFLNEEWPDGRFTRADFLSL